MTCDQAKCVLVFLESTASESPQSTVPSPDNMRTVFEFVVRGLEALGCREHTDYDVMQSTRKKLKRDGLRALQRDLQSRQLRVVLFLRSLRGWVVALVQRPRLGRRRGDGQHIQLVIEDEAVDAFGEGGGCLSDAMLEHDKKSEVSAKIRTVCLNLRTANLLDD